MAKPLIGISTCIKDDIREGVEFHATADPYVQALMHGAEAIPILLPALGELTDIDSLLNHLDGVLFTGSPSNVEPHHYRGVPSREGTHHDPKRDATTLPLIRAAVAHGMPVLGICRGLQEINVALGGTLHQHVHEVPGRIDHRHPDSPLIEEQFAAAHPIHLVSDGLLARMVAGDTVMVNSLHSQGIEHLAPGLVIEATAPDGQIEAIRGETTPGFLLAMQWHPEWQFRKSQLSQKIFQLFGEMARKRL